MAKLESFDNMPELEPVHPRLKTLEEDWNTNLFLPKKKNNDFMEEKDSNSVGRSPGTHNPGVPGSDLDFRDESCHGNSSTFSQSPHQKGKMVVTGRMNEQEKEAVLLNQSRPRNTTTSEESEQEAGNDAVNFGALGRKLAAEGLLLDKLTSIHFTTDNIPPPVLQVAAEKFLTDCMPSKVKRSDGFAWIVVRASYGDDELSASEDEKEEEEEKKKKKNKKKKKKNKNENKDIHGLEDAWAKLNESGEQINFQKIQQLALAHGTLCGKWMIFRRRGIHIDLTWERIFRATVDGRLGLGTSAKVSTADQDENKHVICVYNENFTDQAEVRELESRLRAVGIRCSMMYKPDVFTYLGVYRGNEWSLKPVMYVSEFDLRKNSSVITSNYD